MLELAQKHRKTSELEPEIKKYHSVNDPRTLPSAQLSLIHFSRKISQVIDSKLPQKLSKSNLLAMQMQSWTGAELKCKFSH